jgi:hypothetical protein
VKLLCNYIRCWKWCPRASTQAWTRLILFANIFYTSVCKKFLTKAVIAVFNSLSVSGRWRYTEDSATCRSLSAQRHSERTVLWIKKANRQYGLPTWLCTPSIFEVCIKRASDNIQYNTALIITIQKPQEVLRLLPKILVSDTPVVARVIQHSVWHVLSYISHERIAVRKHNLPNWTASIQTTTKISSLL